MQKPAFCILHFAFCIAMAGTAKSRRSSIDLEEIAPNRFLINNQHIHWLLRREGTIAGKLFELTSWRRDGLLARLREREFKVRTLADMADALPAPPSTPPPIVGTGWRPLVSAIERFSHFDLRNLRWHPLESEQRDGEIGVTIYSGWVLRRRKGRGAASFYLAIGERGGGVGLQLLDETKAMLIGYAQALALDDRPLLAERHGSQIVLPDIDLPPPHRTLLQRVASEYDGRLLVDETTWPLAQQVFERLGMRLRIADEL
jgi:hypothetical protein